MAKRAVERWQFAAVLFVVLFLLAPPDALLAQQVRQTCVGEGVALAGPIDGVTFEWSPGRSLDRADLQRVIASPTGETTYYLSSRKLIGDNLVRNPSFAAGGSDYRSEYVNKVVNRGTELSSGLEDCPDAKDIDNGRYLAVQGDLRDGAKVWCQTVDVVPGATYLFSGRVTSLTTGNTARLQASFGGEIVEGILGSDGQPCTWRGISGAVWINRTEAVSVEVCVINAKTTGGAYAFGIDDLFVGRLSEPRLDSFLVKVNPKIATDLEVRLCPGERFRARNLDLGPGERGSFKLRAKIGCDSTVNVTTVAIDSTPASTIIDLCPGESRNFRGSVITSDTTSCDTIVTASGCEDIRCTTFRFLDADAISFDFQSPSCQGDSSGSLTVRPLAGRTPFTFVWSDSTRGAVRDNLPAGSYTVRVEDGTGCTAESTVALEQPAPLRSAEVLGVDARCADEASGSFSYVGPGGTPPYTLTAKQDSVSFDPDGLTAGAYTLAVTDANGCTLGTQQRIGAPEPPSVELTGPSFIRLADEPRYSLSAVPGDATTTLTFLDQPLESIVSPLDFEFKPDIPGSLIATATDQTGCSVSDTIAIRIQSIDQPFFPTAFSPNGDDRNDVFTVVADPVLQAVLNLRIFDRWGTELYSSGECELDRLTSCGWNGDAAGGVRLDVGVYTYLAQLRLIDGREIVRSGEVSLLR